MREKTPVMRQLLKTMQRFSVDQVKSIYNPKVSVEQKRWLRGGYGRRAFMLHMGWSPPWPMSMSPWLWWEWSILEKYGLPFNYGCVNVPGSKCGKQDNGTQSWLMMW